AGSAPSVLPAPRGSIVTCCRPDASGQVVGATSKSKWPQKSASIPAADSKAGRRGAGFVPPRLLLSRSTRIEDQIASARKQRGETTASDGIGASLRGGVEAVTKV